MESFVFFCFVLFFVFGEVTYYKFCCYSYYLHSEGNVSPKSVDLQLIIKYRDFIRDCVEALGDNTRSLAFGCVMRIHIIPRERKCRFLYFSAVNAISILGPIFRWARREWNCSLIW